MVWDDPIRQAFEQIAKDLKCQVKQTNGGCIFNYSKKEFYFSFFMNSNPNDTFKMVYDKDYVSRKSIGKSTKIGDYKINDKDLDKMKKEMIVIIVDNK